MQNLLQKLMRRPLCLVAVSYAMIVLSVQIFMPPPQSGAAHSFTEGEEVWLTGQLYKKETKKNRQIYYLKEVQIKEKSEKNSNVLNVICYMQDAKEFDVPIGRWLYVKGEVLPFEPAENEGQFDAQSYYEGIGISLRLWDTAVISQGASYEMLGNIMTDVKSDISVKFRHYMSPENAGVLSAMLLGDKTAMDSEVKGLYRKSGIAHVLAISGVNTLNLVSLSKSQMPNLRAFPQVLLRKFTLFYQQILSGFCPLVVLPLFRGCFSKLTKWQKEYLFAKV